MVDINKLLDDVDVYGGEEIVSMPDKVMVKHLTKIIRIQAKGLDLIGRRATNANEDRFNLLAYIFDINNDTKKTKAKVQEVILGE